MEIPLAGMNPLVDKNSTQYLSEGPIVGGIACATHASIEAIEVSRKRSRGVFFLKKSRARCVRPGGVPMMDSIGCKYTVGQRGPK